MDSIFIVAEGIWDESGYSRPYLDFQFDEYSTIGYFTSREAAQAWIDDQQSEGNVRYQAALKEFPVRKRNYDDKVREHNREQDAIVAKARAAGVPYDRKHLYVQAPREPMLSTYVTTEYEIWEIEPHG